MTKRQYCLRFSLWSVLLLVTVVAIALALYVKKRSPIGIMQDIASDYRELGYGEVRFDPNIEPLDRLLAQMGKLPPELKRYLAKRVPASHFDTGLIQFHDVNGLLEEHLDCVPGVAVLEHGFFCIASEGDGSAFAYCKDDRKVYHLGFVNDGDYGGADIAEQIRQDAWESWGSLAEFLLYAKSQMHQNLRVR